MEPAWKTTLWRCEIPKKKACKFYADPIHLDSNEFVEMMLLDSCFIIQLFHKYRNVELRKDDPIFQLAHIQSSMRRDSMLFENQLPFFVLLKLFNMPQNPAASPNSFVCMSCTFLKEATPNVPIKEEFLKSATELHEAGIKFKKVEEGSFFNIKFVNGTIEIPTLKVDDNTESFL
ncbi:hypothetical protein ACSBR1_013227 [Camellia fascicularis]